jgi:hypothetical protein
MQALEGKLPVTELDDAERSAMRFPIYLQACNVLQVSNERKKAYFDSLPPEICAMLKKECRRIYDLRRG